jgi:hypothetical protein
VAIFVISKSGGNAILTESSITIVMEQQVGSRIASHIDIRPALVVEVTR